MQQLLFGEARFVEFQKSNAKQETKYGKIPAEWNYVAIEFVAHQVSTKNEQGDDLPVLSCTKYDGLVDSLTYFGRQIFSEDTSTYRVVKRGQFAYATNHIEEGSIGYQNLHDRALISPMYTVFETNEKIDDGFLYKLLKTELYRHIFETNTSASIDRRGSLRWNMFSQIKIPLPSLKEQKAIAEVIDTCQQEINLTKKKLEALQQQKKGLMQKLLTGQIRVKV
jgi:type I restriction enzyme S subunit